MRSGCTSLAQFRAGGGLRRTVGRMSSRTALGILIAAVAVAAGAVPGVARAADAITSVRTTNGDVVVGKTTGVAISGAVAPTSGSSLLTVDVNPGALPCAETPRLNEERRTADLYGTLESPGPFADATLHWVPAAPGAYVLCAWLGDFDDGPGGKFSLAVTARQPRTSLALTLPAGRFDENSTVPLTITASAEIERWYSVEVNRIGVPCGPSKYANNADTNWITMDRIIGGPTTTTENVTTPFSGRFHVCGWVGVDDSDPSPTTVVDGPTFTVGPPARCHIGAAPRHLSGVVRIDCSGTTEPITLIGRRGSKQFSTTVNLAMGTAYAPATAIGLRHRRRVAVSVKTIDGVTAGTRILRMR